MKGYKGRNVRQNDGKKAKAEKLYRYWAQAVHDKEELMKGGIKTLGDMVDTDNAEMQQHLKAMTAIAKRQKASTKQLRKTSAELLGWLI